MRKTLARFTPEEKFAVGKRLYHNEATVAELAAEFNTSESTIYAARKAYTESIGIPMPTRKAPRKKEKEEEHIPGPAMLKAMQQDYASEKVQQLTPAHWEALVSELEAAKEEVEILRKIVMALGRSL